MDSQNTVLLHFSFHLPCPNLSISLSFSPKKEIYSPEIMGIEVINLKLAAVLGFAGLAIYWFYRVLDWAWLRPKKLEKCLREQGFKGNPYRPFLGDQRENAKLMKEALSKPIGIKEDIRKRIVPHILKTVEIHGKTSFMWFGRIPRVNLTDPELIREVMTKHSIYQKNHHDHDPITKFIFTGLGSLEGEIWSARRKTINAAFHFEKLKLMLPAFYLSATDMLSKWLDKVPDGGSAELDVWHDIEFLTGDAISRTLYGSTYEEGRRIFVLMKELVALVIDVIQSVYIPGQSSLPTKRYNRMREIDREARALITTLIDKRRKAIKAGDATTDDFLGTLLQCNLNETKQQGNKKSEEMMSIEDIICECKLFYFAGQDTSSTLILWTMVLLSIYPEWQQRAREEVLQVFGDQKPDYDGISRLKIVTMILHEVLRLYCPVVEITKVANEDTQLGKYFIPAGVHLMMPQALVHYDPELWGEDVMEFKPDRFAEGVLKAAKSQGSFFPFGLGPRICMGHNFVLLEAKIAMSQILRTFSFELSPSYVHAPITVLTTQPQYGAHLILQKLKGQKVFL